MMKISFYIQIKIVTQPIDLIRQNNFVLSLQVLTPTILTSKIGFLGQKSQKFDRILLIEK